jgi:inosose dehydratase
MTTTPTTSASSAPSSPNQPRIAGAPISWGVCEVPDWGYQLAPSRVLEEMRDIGLAATELGPEGFLPTDPDQMAGVLAAHELAAVGGFTPVVMHRPGHDPLAAIDPILDQYEATHAEVLVLSATSGLDGYDTRPTLDEDGWKLLHPHVGTMVENGEEVQRVLSGSSISLCLDTGHLLIGGTDPADLTRQAPERIAHTHLKDVDSRISDKVRAGRLSYTEAVADGMYRPLGTGDVDVESIVNTLQGNGYSGWYTLEQDTILTEEPRGEGPATDVRTSADHVRALLTAPAAAGRTGAS